MKTTAISMREEGKTYQEIADTLGLSKGVAFGLVNKARYTGERGKNRKLNPDYMTEKVWEFIEPSKIHSKVNQAIGELCKSEKQARDNEDIFDYLLMWIYTRSENSLRKIGQSDKYFFVCLVREGRRWIMNKSRYSDRNEEQFIDGVDHGNN